MGVVQVLTPHDMVFKAFFDAIEPDLILKGDGVVYMGPEGPALMHFAPEHAINPDPNQPDHPMWAHNPHTGELVEGGQHPIDGVATHLQHWLDSNGIHADAQAIIDEAIGAFNHGHITKGNPKKPHELPLFDSPEWRKLVVGPHPTNVPSKEMPVRGRDGRLFTHWSNRGGKIGTFAESGAVPFFDELAAVLGKMGLGHAVDELEYAKFPNISPQLGLAQNVARTRKGELGAMGVIPGHLMEQHGPEGAMTERAHGGVHTWDVAHHLPPIMFAGIGQKPRQNSAVLNDANAHLDEALALIDPSQIPNHPVQIDLGGGDMHTTTFDKAVTDPKLRQAMLTDMHWAPALRFIFHGIGGQSSQSKGRLALNHFLQDLEGMETQQGHAYSGTTEKGRGKHAAAATVAAAAAAHGPWEQDSNRSAMANRVVGLPGEDDKAGIERRRVVLESLADTMSRAHGHRERWAPDWENLPTEPLYSQTLGGPKTLPQEVPPHFADKFYTDLTSAPVRRTLIPALGEVPTGGRAQPSPLTAPSPPPTQAAAPAAPAAWQAHEGPVTSAIRGQVGGMETPQLREFMEAAGRYPSVGGPGRGSRQTTGESRFQQTFGDPHQTMFRFSEPMAVDAFDRIEKAMEEMQLMDARQDVAVLKHMPNRNSLSLNVEGDVRMMADHLGLTSHDVRSLAIAKGDWHRAAKMFHVPPETVAAVKVVFS